MFKGNIIKKCISLVMVIAVLVGLSSPASAAVAEILTDDKYNDYIALGDAITVGKGLDGDDKRYYELLAEDLFKAGLIEEDSYFSYSGSRWRVEELRALLDDEYYDSDAYWNDGYSTSLSGRAGVQNAVANAKYVSVQIGMNNFATYFVKQIMLYLEGKETYAYDFSNFADEDVINAMEKVRDAVMEQLTTVAPSEEAELALDFVNFAVEVAAYALLSYVTNFNGLVEAIYDLNPDVKLYVIGLNNPAAGETLTLTIAGETRTIPVGDAIGAVVEMANAYAQILAPRLPNKDSYTYVDPGDTNRLIDKMADYSLSVYDRIPAALRGELLWYSDTEEEIVVSIQELFWEYGVEKSYEEALAIAEDIVFAATEELRDEYIINSINYLVIEAVLVEFQNKLADYGKEYTDNFTLTKGQIEELLSDLENPPEGKTREEVATEFVEDMMAEAMVGQTIDGMYIETKEDAKNAIKLLESFSGEDTEAKKEYATKIIMQKVNENGLGEYIEENDVRDLLDRMEVSSSKETVVNWMNDVAARKINEKVQALLNTTEDKTTAVKAMLADMEKPGADANAVAKTHLMDMGFRAMIAEKIAEKYTENGLELATFNYFEEFADAIVTAKTTAEAKALIRKEVVASAVAATKELLNTNAPTNDEVLAWFAKADLKKTPDEQKAVILECLVEKYSYDLPVPMIKEFALPSFYGAYVAAVTAETTFVDYTDALNESIGSFSNYLELKGEAANQIYAAYEQYYKGQGANAQEYYKIYKSLKDAATDEVMRGFEKYQSAIDTCKDKCDALCAKFDKMFEMLASVAELDSLCLNDLLDVAADAATNPVDYIDSMIDSLKEGTGLTTGQMTLAYLALCYYIGDGMMHLPSSEGHKTMAAQLFKAINGENTNSTLGGLANAVINKLIDIYHMPTSASGQAAPLVNPNQYVAFGDNITSGNGTAVNNADQIYVQLLADALAMHECEDEHCDHDEVLNLSLDGMRTEELLAIVDRTYNYTGDAYTDARFDIEALREKYQALYADQDLDLVTINVGINNLVTYPITQTMLAYNNETTYELDWGHYIGDGRAAKLEKGKSAMMDLLMGIIHDDSTCETTLRTVAVGIESMIYGLIGFVANLDLAVEEIHKAFPNAVIVLTQLYNPLQGTYFTTPDSIEFKNIRTGNKVTVSELKQFKIDIGDIADGMINVANRFLTRYIGCYGSDEVASVPGSNIVTVSINNTPLDIDESVSKDLAVMEHVVTINVLGADRKIYVPEYLVEAVRTGGVALHPNAEGHQYICDQILKMLKYKIDANIIVDDAWKYYGEDDPTFKYYIDDLSSLYGINIESIVPAYPAGMTATTAVPGYYDLIVTYTAEDGYNSVSVSMSDLAECLNTERKDNLNPQLWIKKMPVTVTVLPETSQVVVNGEMPEFEYTVLDANNKPVDCNVTIKKNNVDLTTVGTYTVGAICDLNTELYEITYVDATVEVIDDEKTQITITVDDKDMVAKNEFPEFTATIEDADGNVITGIALKFSHNAADNETPGTYTITAEIADPAVAALYDVTVVTGTLTINDYVCWNMQTGVYYQIVHLAALEAQEGQTIQMLKNSDQTALTNVYHYAGSVNLINGITLDLQGYTLELESLFAAEGNHVTATTHSSSNVGGKLIVPEENFVLNSAYQGTGRLPVWDESMGWYVFANVAVLNNNDDRILTVDKVNEDLRFQFDINATTYVLNNMFALTGVTDNRMAVEVYFQWETDSGIAYQSFVFTDDMVGQATHTIKNGAASEKDCYFFLTNYSELGIDIDTLSIYARVISNSGAVVEGSVWNTTGVIEPSESVLDNNQYIHNFDSADGAVCINTTTGKTYEIVHEAVLEAKPGEIIQMIANSDQTKLTSVCQSAGMVNLTNGVILDLQDYTLKLDCLIVSSGSGITANTHSAPNAGGKLIVSSKNFIFDANSDGTGRLPVWDETNGWYVFANVAVLNNNDDRVLTVDKVNEDLRFQFDINATTYVLNNMFAVTGVTDNRMSVEVYFQWKTDSGIAYQSFVFTDDLVGQATHTIKNGAATEKDCYFFLTNYSELGIDIDTLTICARVVSNSGAVVQGNSFTAE